ncbi:MAG: ATP-dependent Clp protease proteolytic subunit [Sedimentisphaerales bacterium]|nr:ATP-dependent Clp protease proteolytic subunit [Sedimentisphaerales bacterium]
MPNWNEVLDEIKGFQRPDALDFVRRKYLKALQEKLDRNVIAYYSGWLNKPGMGIPWINDSDKNAFMTTIHQLDRSKGLDLILHTPGGDIAATESIVDYLHRMFGGDIRAIVPQIAMSAGTMIACACKAIVMGRQSNLGPIDPQLLGISAQGVQEEFERAKNEIKSDPATIPLWQTIVAKYPIAFIGDCEKAMKWAYDVVSKWLENNMLSEEENKSQLAESIVKHLSDHDKHKSHGRHIHIDECKQIGLKIISLDDNEDGIDHEKKDLILTVHHAFMHTFFQTTAIKIVENHLGRAVVSHHAHVQTKTR